MCIVLLSEFVFCLVSEINEKCYSVRSWYLCNVYTYVHVAAVWYLAVLTVDVLVIIYLQVISHGGTRQRGRGSSRHCIGWSRNTETSWILWLCWLESTSKSRTSLNRTRPRLTWRARSRFRPSYRCSPRISTSLRNRSRVPSTVHQPSTIEACYRWCSLKENGKKLLWMFDPNFMYDLHCCMDCIPGDV